MKRIMLIAAIALLAACGDDDDSERFGGLKEEAEERIDTTDSTEFDIEDHEFQQAIAYYRELVPGASEEQIRVWYDKTAEWNKQVDAWNECLETSPDGSAEAGGCIEPDDSLIEDVPK